MSTVLSLFCIKVITNVMPGYFCPLKPCSVVGSLLLPFFLFFFNDGY